MLCIVTIGTSAAQTTKPLVKDGATWMVVIAHGGGGTGEPYEEKVDRYTIDVDSMINGKQYKGLSGGVWLREDSTGKVYILHPSQRFGCHGRDSSEHLLYDFGVKTGDSLTYYRGDWGDSMVCWVGPIDTIIISGQKRARYSIYRNTINNPNPDTWIEGIGSIYGIYFPYCDPFEVSFYLGCYIDSEIYYQGNPNKPCEYLGFDMMASGLGFNIYPNPTSGMLSIDLGKVHYELKIEVFNQQGQLVDRHSVSGTSLVELIIPGPPGIYMISLSTGAERATFKVMKL